MMAKRWEHYRRAEMYLDIVAKLADSPPGLSHDVAMAFLAKAQVNATLASVSKEVAVDANDKELQEGTRRAHERA